MLIPEFLEGLADRLRTIPSLTVTTDPGVGVVVDMALVEDGEIDYHSTFARGYDAVTFRVTVYVSRADSNEGVLQARLYKSGHGDLSLRAAIESPTGPNDPLVDMPSIVCDTARVDTAGAGEATYVTVVLEGTAQLAGKES